MILLQFTISETTMLYTNKILALDDYAFYISLASNTNIIGSSYCMCTSVILLIIYFHINHIICHIFKYIIYIIPYPKLYVCTTHC